MSSEITYPKLGQDMSLKEVLLSLPKIEKYKVSVKARQEGGFLTKFIEADGDLLKLSDELLAKRHSFLLRTVASYQKKPSWRRYLSLLAWAYKPYQISVEPEKKKRGRKRASQVKN